MVTLSERAAAKVRELLAAENDPTLTALRVAVEGGGCSGFQYALGFDSAPESGDESVEVHGVRVIVDRSSLPYLCGADVDYIDGLMGAGFQIEQPQRRGRMRLWQLVPGQGRGRGRTVPAAAEADCGTGCGCSH